MMHDTTEEEHTSNRHHPHHKSFSNRHQKKWIQRTEENRTYRRLHTREKRCCHRRAYNFPILLSQKPFIFIVFIIIPLLYILSYNQIMGNIIGSSSPSTGVSCEGIFGNGPCCFTITGEEFNADPQELWDFCDENNCCNDGNGGSAGTGYCNDWSDSPDAYYTICEDACKGDEACQGNGVDAATSSSINFVANQESCVGNSACYRTCELTSGDCSIGKNSCVGEDACYNIGYQFENDSMTMGDDSCRGERACKGLGRKSETTITIDNGACVGVFACFLFAANIKDGISIGSNSCQGKLACSSFALYSNEAPVSIGRNSCIASGDEGNSCNSLGLNAQQGVTVGNNACHGDYGCYNTGKYHEQVTISWGACRNGDDSECYECSDECFLYDDCADICNTGESLEVPTFGFTCPYNN